MSEQIMLIMLIVSQVHMYTVEIGRYSSPLPLPSLHVENGHTEQQRVGLCSGSLSRGLYIHLYMFNHVCCVLSLYKYMYIYILIYMNVHVTCYILFPVSNSSLPHIQCCHIQGHIMELTVDTHSISLDEARDRLLAVSQLPEKALRVKEQVHYPVPSSDVHGQVSTSSGVTFPEPSDPSSCSCHSYAPAADKGPVQGAMPELNLHSGPGNGSKNDCFSRHGRANAMAQVSVVHLSIKHISQKPSSELIPIFVER